MSRQTLLPMERRWVVACRWVLSVAQRISWYEVMARRFHCCDNRQCCLMYRNFESGVAGELCHRNLCRSPICYVHNECLSEVVGKRGHAIIRCHAREHQELHVHDKCCVEKGRFPSGVEELVFSLVNEVHPTIKVSLDVPILPSRCGG